MDSPGEEAAPRQHRTGPAIWTALLLFVITAALFYRAGRADFLVYDDTTFVTRNQHVKTGLSAANIKDAFFGMDDVNWQPLTTLSHTLDCQLFGLNPRGHHLVNVFIHALNTALLFLLLRKITKATWRSFIVAALFGLHPLRVESVAWVAERKDVLCMLFWLLATWAYARYVEEQNRPAARWYYRLCLFLFALGLMAKPMLVTFPFFLMLLDYWPLKRIGAEGFRIGDLKPVVLDKIPMVLLTIADCLVTFCLQKQYGALETAFPFYMRAGNALVSYARYLGKFIWPTRLAVLYPLTDHWTAMQLILAASLVLGISAVALVLVRRAPWMTVGWCWYLGTLVPVIGLVQVGEQSLADRYTYMPMIGITLAVVWGACELTRRWPSILQAAPVVALICCYAVLTWKQLAYWQDSLALFEHTVQVTRDNYVADVILADVYHANGEPARALDLLTEARRVSPDFVPAVELQKAWRCEQDLIAGKNYMQQRKLDRALPYFQEAALLRHSNAEAHYSLGVIYSEGQQLQDAVTEFRLALLFKPDSYQAQRHLAYALAHVGKSDEAMREFKSAARKHPDSYDAHVDLAQALAMSGKRDESIVELKQALQIRPGDPIATAHLAQLEGAGSQ